MESNHLLLTGLVVAVFAAVHVSGGKLTLLDVTPRSIWLSLAGGVSVAYVFVHLLPELAEHDERLSEGLEEAGGPLAGLENHIHLLALAGLATFYGLDRLAKQSARNEARAGRERKPSAGVFWIHLVSFAIYNVIIGYLLVHREESGLSSLLVYGFAMAVHFVINDHALREHHGRPYDRKGRWLLAAAPVAGWVLGLETAVSTVLISILFALLAGGVVLNVLKEELPEERESRFWAFGLGAAAYAALLLAGG